MSEFTNTNLSNNELCIKLADIIISNLTDLFNTAEINVDLDFEIVSKILDNFLLHVYVAKDKTNDSYIKSKKNFSKLLSCNYKLIKDNIELSEIIINNEQKTIFFELFEDGPNKHWIKFFFIVVSYLSFIKQSNKDPNINYNGMIDKLSNKIEEYNDLENSDSTYDDENLDSNDDDHNDEDNTNELFTLNDDAQILLNQLRENIPNSTTESTNIMKNLLGDIKGMLSSGNNIETQNIINFNFNLMKSFNEQWDVSSMDNFLKLALMLSSNKYTNTLKSILENDNNLNVIFDKNNEYGLIYM